MSQPSTILYHEEQVFRSWWLWLIVGIVAAMQWWGFWQQIILGEAWGSKPAPDWMMVILWIVFGIGLPVFFLYTKLIVTVSNKAVDVFFRPVMKRTYPITHIVKVEERTYSPLSEFGGWGIRGGLHGIRAFSASGNQGVDLTLADGRKILLGTLQPDELAQAINHALGQQQN